MLIRHAKYLVYFVHTTQNEENISDRQMHTQNEESAKLLSKQNKKKSLIIIIIQQANERTNEK
jgi:hypothetical protein